MIEQRSKKDMLENQFNKKFKLILTMIKIKSKMLQIQLLTRDSVSNRCLVTVTIQKQWQQHIYLIELQLYLRALVSSNSLRLQKSSYVSYQEFVQIKNCQSSGNWDDPSLLRNFKAQIYISYYWNRRIPATFGRVQVIRLFY
ncbi:Hypothetical_protein [Hexamita inflata]|uniref:Hypothetical_protein n=1 Tax=Hexamita inflata TaxID=28002 RepID=A0AA86V0Y9_9EUKA|nr:Hypothetical protein HINF_LOCUS63914 [Hexamita inflata]